jgi:hypothetical protein
MESAIKGPVTPVTLMVVTPPRASSRIEKLLLTGGPQAFVKDPVAGSIRFLLGLNTADTYVSLDNRAKAAYGGGHGG